MNQKCKYCGRNVQEVGDQHFVDDTDNTVVCEDCGVKRASPEPQAETAPMNPGTNEKTIDISGFQIATFEVLQERVHQVVEKGYSPSHDMNHTMGDFLIYMERYMNICKHMLCSDNPQEVANARKAFVKIVALGVAYLESHPMPSRG